MRSKKRIPPKTNKVGWKSSRHINRILTFKVPYRFFMYVTRGLLALAGTIVVSMLIYYFYLFFIFMRIIPGKESLAVCESLLVSFSSQPSYGVIINQNGKEVKEMFIVSKDGVDKLNTVRLDYSLWIPIYFSDTFTATQIGQIQRFAEFNKQSVDYCSIIEQIGLTTGVPIEFLIVREKDKTILSTVSMRDINSIFARINKGQNFEIDVSKLPLIILKDETKVRMLSFTSFKEQFPDFFKLDDIAQEQAFVEIYNASSISGYGNLIARKLAMLGVEVSRIGNAPARTEDENFYAIIYLVDPKAYTKTVSLIISTLPNNGYEIREGRPPQIVTTGDIVVILVKR